MSQSVSFGDAAAGLSGIDHYFWNLPPYVEKGLPLQEISCTAFFTPLHYFSGLLG